MEQKQEQIPAQEPAVKRKVPSTVVVYLWITKIP